MPSIREIVEKQRAYFGAGMTRSPMCRRLALRKLGDAVRAHEDEICAALAADLHKTACESYMTEVGMVLDELRYMEEQLEKWSKPRRVPTPLAQFPARSFVVPEPYGVALIMAPWNYPFQLCLEPLIGAVAAGNCAVVKPSAYAPATSHAVAKLLAEVFPPEYVAVVEGGRAENTALLDEAFDYIFFTGSVEVGKLVMAAAAKHLTPVSLELGGKSPAIVDETADIPLAAKRIAFGKFLNAGQTCVAPDYILVQASVRDRLLAELEKSIRTFFPGGDYSQLPAIINDKHFARLTGLLQNEHIACGGSSDAARRFIEPTVLRDVASDAPVMQQEIFGPILPVLTFDTAAEAAGFVTARPKPLALYLFTADKDTETLFLRNVSFGGGCVNDTIIHLATHRMGFGGVGSSGMGSYHGKDSFDTFTHYKSIVKKSTRLDLPLRYLPYTEKNFRMIRKFLR